MWLQLLTGALAILNCACASFTSSETRFDSETINTVDIIGKLGLFSGSISSGEVQNYVYVPQPKNSSDLLYVSGNMELQPPGDNSLNDTNLMVCLSWIKPSLNVSEITQQAANCSSFSLGYYGALLATNSSTSSMYVSIIAPSIANATIPWSFSLGVSPDKLLYNWASRAFTDVLDTDYNSALLVTGPLVGRVLNSTSVTFHNLSYSYDLYLYPSNYTGLQNLQRSWIAVTNGPAIYTTKNQPATISSRGGGLHQQFYLTNLTPSTLYTAYLTASGSGYGQRSQVYSLFTIQTMDTPACKIIFDLDFCQGVAYSVPVSSHIQYNDTNDLKEIYDSRVATLYTNFSKALQQVACNATDEDRFSPLITCTNCIAQYKTWLCAVTIPRCSTYYQDGYSLRDHGESRNEFVNEVIEPPLPYYEVKPCINLCNDMVKDCPAQLNFACPTSMEAILESYGVFRTDLDYDTCNLISEAYFLLTWGMLSRGENQSK